MERDNRLRPLLVDSLQAHTLQFATPLAPTYGDAVGVRILVAFLAVGVGALLLLRLAADTAEVRGLPVTNLAVVAALLAAFVVVQRLFVGRPLADVGLRPIADWTRLERLYFFQVVPLAVALFAVVFGDRLMALLEQHGLAGFLLFSVVAGIAWGMVQEFIYRGWLQTELTRRFGATVGLLAANTVFTLGPLHFNHLVDPGGVRWAGLAAVFGIGLFFGIIYQRSGNLWIPAVLHGLWPPNMT